MEKEIFNSEKILTFEEKPFEYVMVNGEPMFSLKDTAEILDIVNPRTSIDTTNEKYVMKITNSIVGSTYNSNRQIYNTGELFLTEAGLYRLIFQSRKPNALQFQDWVCGEVLPSIRKHGAYISEDIINDNRKLRETIKEMQEEYSANKEKIDFADVCLESDTSHYINDLALYLNKYHIKIGQNQLFEKLISQGYLYRRADGSIFPKMVYVKRGYFTVTKAVKGKRTTSTVMVTDKGQMYFLNKFREEKSNEQMIEEPLLFDNI